MQSKGERAAELFVGGFNCAQSVVTAFSEDYDVDEETALKMSCGLGGGCGIAELCGVLTGGTLVVGMKHGQYILEDNGAKANCRAKRDQFVETFIEKNGSATCRGLLGFDLTTDEGAEKYAEIFKDRVNAPCTGFVRSSAQILEELGY